MALWEFSGCSVTICESCKSLTKSGEISKDQMPSYPREERKHTQHCAGKNNDGHNLLCQAQFSCLYSGCGHDLDGRLFQISAPERKVILCWFVSSKSPFKKLLIIQNHWILQQKNHDCSSCWWVPRHSSVPWWYKMSNTVEWRRENRIALLHIQNSKDMDFLIDYFYSFYENFTHLLVYLENIQKLYSPSSSRTFPLHHPLKVLLSLSQTGVAHYTLRGVTQWEI